MRTILVTNAKGGCGKSTIATNLAAYYASEGYETALADFDPQGSSLDWLAERPAEIGPITGLKAFEDGLNQLPRGTEFLIVDAPARSTGKELTTLLRRAESVIVPVLPSPIDMKAAAKFISELLSTRKVSDKKAIDANTPHAARVPLPACPAVFFPGSFALLGKPAVAPKTS